MALTVLVVEDELKIRELLRSYLEREGWSVLTTGSGAEAITLAGTADPDLVITPYLDSVGGPFLQQAAQVGYVDTKFANYGGSSAQVAAAPEISEFTYMLATRAPDNPDDEVVADFRAAYEEKFDQEPKPLDTYALMVYDPLLMLAQAVEDAGTSTDIAAISKALREVTDWNGKALPFSFDGKGLIQLETMQLATLRDGVTTYTDFVP